jgi:hypothetical protein
MQMKQKIRYPKVKLALGCFTLAVGFLAANLALFHWVERTDLYYLLGEFARYVCAYGGFGAMIFGAILINDFLNLRNSTAKRPTVKPLKIKDAYQKILAKTAWLLAEDLKKSSITYHEITTLYNLEKEEEIVVAQQHTQQQLLITPENTEISSDFNA